MGFLKRFFKGVFDEGVMTVADTSFKRVTDQQLEAHLGIANYGSFSLTDAVRPSFDLKVTPQQGYRHDFYQDEESNARIPVVMASASKEMLFELFMDLLTPLGNTVDVVLETSHHQQGGHEDLYREHIDLPVLKSTLWDFEELLLNDGCTGVAVLNPDTPQEVQFDEHKLLIVYGSPLERFEHILEVQGITCNEEIKFITEAEHVHSSCDDYYRQFDQLKTRLGMDGSSEEMTGECGEGYVT